MCRYVERKFSGLFRSVRVALRRVCIRLRSGLLPGGLSRGQNATRFLTPNQLGFGSLSSLNGSDFL